MNDESFSRTDTAYASPSRADLPTLKLQRDAFQSDRTAVALLEAMPVPALVLNARRQVLCVNRALQDTYGVRYLDRVFGLRPGEALGCVHANERAAGCGTTRSCARCGAVNAVLEALVGRRRVVRDVRLRTRRDEDGGALDLRVSATFVEVGGEGFVVVGLLDISDERRRAVLERLVSHDLADVAADLAAAADRIASALPEDGAADLLGAAGRLADALEGQRQLLEAERGRLHVRTVAVDLGRLLGELVERHRRMRSAAGRAIVLECARHCTVETDPALLGRAVSDLLVNALEATDAGGTVAVACECGQGTATISVHNDRVMPEEVQQQVFQRSFSTRDGAGRGIGAYRARLITEGFLGGSLEFMSNDRLGTLFVVMVPDRQGDSPH